MQVPFVMRSLLLSILFVCFNICAVDKPKDTKKMDLKPAASPKTAVVNVNRIITTTPELLAGASEEWRGLHEKIQETLAPAKSEIKSLEEKFKTKMKDLETLQKTGVSSREALQKKYMEEVAPLEQQLQQTYQQASRFEQEEYNKAYSMVEKKIKKICEALLKSQGWDKIDRADTVLAVSERFDITDEVLRTLNKEYADEKAKKAASKA